jgi:uncharacterized membrane protein
MMPLAALALGSPPVGRGLRALTTALAIAELVADKLPFVPHRTRAPPALVRALPGAPAAGFAERRARSSPLAGALLGSPAAVAATRLGHRLRLAAKAVAPPAVVASVEDVCAAATAIRGASVSGAPIGKAK